MKHGHIKLKPKGINISQTERDQQYQLRQKIREMKESDGEDSPKQYRIRNMRSQSNALGDWEFLPVNMPVRQKTSTMKLRKSLYNT